MINLQKAFSKKIILSVIFLLIVVSLIFTSISDFLFRDNNNYIVKVNGEKINQEQLEQAFIREHERQNKILGKEYTSFINNENYIKQLHQQVLTQLIDNVLLEQYAKKLNLTVSDEKVKEIIFDQSIFKVNEKFDNKKYLEILNTIHLTPTQYVEILKKQLPTQQLITSILNTNFILNDELNYLLKLFTEKRIVRTVVLKIQNNVLKQNVTKEDINNYYEKNKNNFIKEEKFQVNYIHLNQDNMYNFLPVIHYEEIKNWYDQHQSDFIKKQNDLYSIIQVSTKLEAEKILNKIKNGADFKKIAKEKAEVFNLSQYKNGSIGWIEHDSMSEELKKANLTRKGQISEIIPLSTGFLIVRLDDVKPQRILSLNSVKKIIIDQIKQEKNSTAYNQLQSKINDEINRDHPLMEKIENIANVKMIKTDWFDQYHLPLELRYKPIEKFIFDHAAKNDLKFIKIDDRNCFIIHILNHQPKRLKTLLEAKKQIINIIKYNKALISTRKQAQKIVHALKSNHLHSIKQWSFNKEKIFSRDTQDVSTQTIFSMSKPDEKKSSYTIFEDYQGNILILSLDKIFNSKISIEQKEAFIAEWIQRDVQVIFNAILMKLRQEAKIKYALHSDFKL